MPDNQVTYTHTTVSVDDATEVLVAANADRKFLRIDNADAALIVYIKVDVAAVVAEGIRIGPGGSYTMRADANNVDPRVVNAIASAGGGAAVSVTQA